MQISISLALQELTDQVETMIDSRLEYEKQLGILHDLVKDALENGVARSIVMDLTGYSQAQLTNIKNAQYSRFYEGPLLSSGSAKPNK